ncbi:MAG TPA: hypothetical protein DIU15_11755 [Deltaproteobacteria bacterium]|nr:hypothetical protein [Deltaproteobacteria bacterium]
MTTTPTTRSLGAILVLLVLWTAMQCVWLDLDERIVEGDVMGNVGAVELFRIDRWKLSVTEVLTRSYLEDYGEYPALYPALMGIGLAAIDSTDLNGDTPALVGLAWSWLAVLSTWALGWALAGPRVAWWGATLLLLSPLWAGMQRHVLLENGVVALVALTAAASIHALRARQVHHHRAALGSWAAAGLTAGLALLVKQTAALALFPILVVATLGGRGVGRWREALAGPCLCVATAGALAAPWYLRHGASHDAYLTRSLQANPDAVGPLHQLAYYPLVLLQLPYAPAALLACGLLALHARRTPEPPPDDQPWLRWARVGLPFAAALGGIALLMLLPKKYPRLLVPLLPLITVGFAVHVLRWPRLHRALVLSVLGASLIASSFQLGPVSSALGVTRVGLVDVDERCFQSWVEPPSRPGLDWDDLLATLERAGLAKTAYRVGASKWPVPPCSHQTTHDLGQHLRIRARRAGLKTRVLAGEDAWEIAGQWTEGPPSILLSDGPDPCQHDPAACEGLGEPILVKRFPDPPPGWPIDLHLFRVSDQPKAATGDQPVHTGAPAP